jgi:hypothetical protein
MKLSALFGLLIRLNLDLILDGVQPFAHFRYINPLAVNEWGLELASPTATTTTESWGSLSLA